MRISSPRKSGFTLIELLVAITIIALLISLVVVGLTASLRAAKIAGEKQAAASIKLGVEQFKQEFGFLPPLVLHDDDSTVAGSPIRPVASLTGPVADVINTPGSRIASEFNNNTFLEGFFGTKGMTSDARLETGSPVTGYVADRRFSEYSLAYYLVGALPSQIDGVDGPGMNAPLQDGTFDKQDVSRSSRVKSGARVYQPLVDISRGKPKLDVELSVRNTGEPAYPIRYRLLAPNGKPYRYYRWAPRKNYTATFRKWDFYVVKNFADEDEVDRLDIPSILGNPRENSQLLDAQFAIVSAGPDGFFGDMPLEAKAEDALFNMQGQLGVPRGAQYNARTRDTARRDNVVEVGR